MRYVHFHEGDFIHKGEVVAELDDKDLRLKLHVPERDYETMHQKAIKFRGEGRTADCTIAELEGKKTEQNIKLLEWQLEKTKIRAPFDGILLTPRLHERIGIMVQQGDLVCRMADLNKLVLEILVPEGEISYIVEGMSVEFIMNPAPEKKRKANVIRIAEEATVDSDGRENVFIVTCQLSDLPVAFATQTGVTTDRFPLPGEFGNDEAAFRPGMKGKAKVICGKRRIGYLLVRKLWNFIRLRLWF